MSRTITAFDALVAVALSAPLAEPAAQPPTAAAAAPQPVAARPAAVPDTILYGVAYYHEYMPYERLDKDVELMKRAGITVVRVGESTWTSWEPREGEFHFDWMDRIVSRMQAAGIKVIMGTPTYSVPPWLYAKHPEIMVVPKGQVRTPREFYGMRQNMDISHPVYRQYCERIIRRIAEHYGRHPGVVGWQIDNETGAYGTAGPNVQAGFKEWLKRKFGTVDAMNRAWGLVYWGQLVDGWDDLPPVDGVLNPGWKLEWERYQRWLVTDFLRWQAGLVREYAEPRQWVTQDFHGATRTAVDSQEIAKFLDVASINPYHDTQERLDGWWISFMGDFTRSMKRAPYLVTETNAQTTGWDAKRQYPPFDGQLRLQAWTHVASGAHMVEYWHWHSLHYGQETYWKGLLGHDLEPNRVYQEATRVGAEFKRLGPQLSGMMPRNRVAILHSVDSHWGLSFMPMGDDVRDERGRPQADYTAVEDQLHRALYDLDVGADFVFAEEPDFAGYDVLVVPPLYVATDALLERIAEFARAGGQVLLAPRAGFTNEYGTVRWTRMPGPLREACGFSYQEFSSLHDPLQLKGDPFGVGAEANTVSTWADMILPETAKALAFYDHPFFGRYPALTRNAFGRGSVTYQGTILSQPLQQKVVAEVLEAAGIAPGDEGLPPRVRARHLVSRDGRPLHFYLNFSGEPQAFDYPHGPATDLLADRPVAHKQRITLGPWDLTVIRE
ncbi:MAG TPA: beta-galactosidase [Vicinamibacteria bacterium]|nr:beta-galactosidase [Vicinamibacteria bacterium]